MVEILILFEEDAADIATRVASSAAERGYQVWGDPRHLRFATDDEMCAAADATRACVLLLSPQMARETARRPEAYRRLQPASVLVAKTDDDLQPPKWFEDCKTFNLGDADTSDLERLTGALAVLAGPPPCPEKRPVDRLRDAEEQAAGWRAIRELKSAEAHRHYLHRFGEHALFSSLARQQAAHSEKKEKDSEWARRAAALSSLKSPRRSQGLLWSGVGAAATAGAFVAATALGPATSTASSSAQTSAVVTDASQGRRAENLKAELDAARLALRSATRQRDEAERNIAKLREENESAQASIAELERQSLKLKLALAKTPSPFASPAARQGDAEGAAEETVVAVVEAPDRDAEHATLLDAKADHQRLQPMQMLMAPAAPAPLELTPDQVAPPRLAAVARTDLGPTSLKAATIAAEPSSTEAPEESAPPKQRVASAAASAGAQQPTASTYEPGALEAGAFPAKPQEDAEAGSKEDPEKDLAEIAPAEPIAAAKPASVKRPVTTSEKQGKSFPRPVKRILRELERKPICDPLVKPC